MKIFVTGASGFLGKQIVLNLLDRGHTVLALSRHDLNFIHNELVVVFGSLEMLLNLKKINGIDAVIHCAANINYSNDYNNLKQMMYDNVESTFHLLEFMKFNGIRKLIFSSTSSIYTENYDSKILINEYFPITPKNYSGITKISAEFLINNFCKKNNISFITLRYSSIYGFDQNAFSILPLFISNALSGKTLKIFGSGKRTQDYVFIEDIVNLNINILENNLFLNEVFNIGSGEYNTDLQLAQMILKITNSKSEIEIQNNQSIESFFTYDISLASTYLNFLPRMLNFGLKSIIGK